MMFATGLMFWCVAALAIAVLVLRGELWRRRWKRLNPDFVVPQFKPTGFDMSLALVVALGGMLGAVVMVLAIIHAAWKIVFGS